MIDLTSRLEIDVMQANELQPAIDLACKHQMPALIVHPQLVTDAILQRARRKGRFKVIVPVDWPRGENFGMNKMRGMTKNALSAEGFELLLTGGKTETENRNEAQVLTDFISRHISGNTEIRFVLGAQMRPAEEVLQMCRALIGLRSPAFVRTDHHLKVQVSKGGIEAQGQLADRIREVIQYPLKASGNFVTARAVAGCPWAARVAVGLAQAQQIIKDLSRQPQGLREMLT